MSQATISNGLRSGLGYVRDNYRVMNIIINDPGMFGIYCFVILNNVLLRPCLFRLVISARKEGRKYFI